MKKFFTQENIEIILGVLAIFLLALSTGFYWASDSWVMQGIMILGTGMVVCILFDGPKARWAVNISAIALIPACLLIQYVFTIEYLDNKNSLSWLQIGVEVVYAAILLLVWIRSVGMVSKQKSAT